MSKLTSGRTDAASRAIAHLPVTLTSEEASRVSGGEISFEALKEWREQNWWLDQSMANRGMTWNGEVYVATRATFVEQGIEPPPPNPNRG
jgi:hypothetical protein